MNRLRWTLKTRLAALTLALGSLALFGDPYRGDTVTLNTRELASIVESEVDHVTVDELASWIVQGRNDYRLLDVREEPAFAEYHIPTAESVQLTELADYPLFRNETIVLYSDGGMHSAQAWFLLGPAATPAPGSCSRASRSGRSASSSRRCRPTPRRPSAPSSSGGAR